MKSIRNFAPHSAQTQTPINVCSIHLSRAYISACPALGIEDFAYEILTVETSEGVLPDPEDIVVLDSQLAPVRYCLTAPWILFDLRLLHHVTGFQFMDSNVLNVSVAHGISRDSLRLDHPVSKASSV